MSKDESSASNVLNNFLNFIKELDDNQQKEFRNFIFNNKINISKSPQDAEKRFDYEEYLKNGQISLTKEQIEQIQNIFSNFILDIMKKNIKND